MSFPVILVNSATGSDTAASGAGPSTALTGTTASTDAGGTVVTLDAGTVLTSVSTAGDHVIFINDSTAGDRNFASINNVSGSGGATPQVTVNEAFTGLLIGETWAIGGKRATALGSISKLLLENNSSDGDAMPGWIVQMESGHSETSTSRVVIRRSGDTTNGPISFIGVKGASVIPIITFNFDDVAIYTSTDGKVIGGFIALNTNGSKTSSVIVQCQSRCIIKNIYNDDSTNFFWKGIVIESPGGWIYNNTIAWCADHGIDDQDGEGHYIFNNYIHDCGNIGINSTSDDVGYVIDGNICSNNANGGIYVTLNNSLNRLQIVKDNTCDNNGAFGLRIANSGQFAAINNILSNNATFGMIVDQSDTEITEYGSVILNNDTYLNTSGAYNSATGSYSNTTCPWASGDPGLNPQFTNAGSGDYTIGTNLASLGFPSLIGATGPTTSYVDIGASQRIPSGGGGTTGFASA